jgi:hypothetical protein
MINAPTHLDLHWACDRGWPIIKGWEMTSEKTTACIQSENGGNEARMTGMDEPVSWRSPFSGWEGDSSSLSSTLHCTPKKEPYWGVCGTGAGSWRWLGSPKHRLKKDQGSGKESVGSGASEHTRKLDLFLPVNCGSRSCCPICFSYQLLTSSPSFSPVVWEEKCLSCLSPAEKGM